MTPDPLAEWHFNNGPYNYVQNNPLLYIDPFGLFKTWVGALWYKIRHGGKIHRATDRNGEWFVGKQLPSRNRAAIYERKFSNDRGRHNASSVHKNDRETNRPGIILRGAGHGWESLAPPTTGPTIIWDLMELLRIFGLLELTPKIKPDTKPDELESTGKALKEIIPTPDKKIVKEHTGNGEQTNNTGESLRKLKKRISSDTIVKIVKVKQGPFNKYQFLEFEDTMIRKSDTNKINTINKKRINNFQK